MKSKFYIFYRWVRYGPFCFCYRMRHLRQQIATTCAAYARNGLPHAEHTLAIGYRMRSIHQQSTEYLNICYRMRSVCKQLPYAQHLLPYAKFYRMRSISLQRIQFYTILLPHVQCALAICYRMCSVVTQSEKSLLTYTVHTLTKIKWYVSAHIKKN